MIWANADAKSRPAREKRALGTGYRSIAPRFANPFTYTGRRLDSETGLYYYRNRYYHAQLGRFISRDPIGYEGSRWNLYEYVEGEPLGSTDPSGRMVAPPPFKGPPAWQKNLQECCSSIPILGLTCTKPAVTPAEGAGQVGLVFVIVCGKQAVDIICRPWGVEDGPAKEVKCIRNGEGGCVGGTKECNYACDNGKKFNVYLDCGPGNWDPHCEWEKTFYE